MSPDINEFVLNDAAIKIGTGHAELLHKGLSFIPTPTDNKTQIRKELDRLRRSLNLKVFWGLRGNPKDSKSLLSRMWKSTWNPPEYFKHTEVWQKTQDLLTKADKHSKRSNLSQAGRKAWDELLTATEVYTLKADKGGKTVTWSKENYLKEAHRQLSDRKVYQELSEEEMKAELLTLIKDRNSLAGLLLRDKFITSKDHSSIIARPANTSAIYFLPKIHKEVRPDTNTFAGRPILAAMNSTTRDFDLFLASLTEPLLKLIPGSLQDTTALINDLESLGTLPKGCTLFSADVVSLYPSIPWDEGIKAATQFYASRFHILLHEAEENHRLRPPNPRLFKQMLTLVVKRNIFHLQNKKWFHQLSGTAMGCSISVYFANTFMYYRTAHLLNNPPPGLLYLGRYIDDLIGIWKGDKNEIIPAFEGVTDDSLKLTFVISDDPLEALDLTISINSEDGLDFRLFRKPTDGHQYVHFTSMHPPALLRSIPYSQLLRLRRNTTHTKDFDNEAAALLQRLNKRGYPTNLLLRAYTQTIYKIRRTLLNPMKANEAETRLTFITKYSSGKERATRKALNFLYTNISKEIAAYNLYIIEQIPLDPPRIAYQIAKRIDDGLGRQYKKGAARIRPTNE
jgi:peptide-methionine (R)-S-oxide reductase